MPWRICRVLDFTKHCTSIHSNEEVAKIETANQLLSLIDKLEADVPRYRGPWAYEKYHPGFVDDLVEMIQAVRRRIEDGDAWGAYDDWHRFLQHWDRVLVTPLWVQVGTVLVEGPGPTVTPSYKPSDLYRHRPKGEAATRAEPDIKKAYMMFFEELATKVISRKQEAGEYLQAAQVLNEVIRAAEAVKFDPTKEQDPDWAWKHYFDLIIKNVEEKFGVKLGE